MTLTITSILEDPQPFMKIEEVAVVLQTTVDGVRAKLRSGTIPPPRRGRPLVWPRRRFLAWCMADPGEWMPPPYKGPKPSKAA